MSNEQIINAIKEKAKEISELIKQFPENSSLNVFISNSKLNLQLEEKIKTESSHE